MSTHHTIIGNLVKDPELRFTPNGKAVINLYVAQNDKRYNSQTQQWEDGEATFWSVSAWNGMAQNAAESFKKGMRVIACGKVVNRQYQDREGNQRTQLELRVDRDGALGPDLLFSTAVVERQASNNTTATVQQAQQDTWNSQPAGGGFDTSDEVPF